MKKIIKYTLSNKNYPFATVQDEKVFIIPNLEISLNGSSDNNALEESKKIEQEAELFLSNLFKLILFNHPDEDGEGCGKWEYDILDSDSSHIVFETKNQELEISILDKYE